MESLLWQAASFEVNYYIDIIFSSIKVRNSCWPNDTGEPQGQWEIARARETRDWKWSWKGGEREEKLPATHFSKNSKGQRYADKKWGSQVHHTSLQYSWTFIHVRCIATLVFTLPFVSVHRAYSLDILLNLTIIIKENFHAVWKVFLFHKCG